MERGVILLGTLVNGIAIASGSLLGIFFTGMRKEIHETVMQGIGLVVLVIGLSMALESQNFISVLLSLAIGGILGGWLKVEDRLNQFGKWVENRWKGESPFATGFVTGTLVYCIGPMAVLGGLDSGLRGDHEVLYTKSLLDGFTAILFSSSLGSGVLFSMIPVVLYEGAITLSAGWITHFLDKEALDQVIQQVTATGGILIIGIGINLLGLGKIRVGDLLPAIPVAVAAALVMIRFSI